MLERLQKEEVGKSKIAAVEERKNIRREKKVAKELDACAPDIPTDVIERARKIMRKLRNTNNASLLRKETDLKAILDNIYLHNM